MQGESWPDWRMWLLAAGVEGIDPTRGIYFNETAIAIQAAIDGQGVALGDTSLVAHDLASGRLVRPFDLSLKGPSRFAYYIDRKSTRLNSSHANISYAVFCLKKNKKNIMTQTCKCPT